jgi:hypothetical protein
MSENKTGKYVKYAIGEILLVVIGILIALQVNNWNEARKQNLLEIQLLKDLKTELEFMQSELGIVAAGNEEDVEEYISIRKSINEDLPYNSSLDNAFGQLDTWSMPYLRYSAYRAIKDNGMDIISNDSLKKQIIDFYEFTLKILEDDMGQWEWSFNQNTTQRIMIANVRRHDSNFDLATPNDFEALKKDDEFRNFLNILIPIRSDHIEKLNYTKTSTLKVLEAVNNELESRQ